MRVRNRRYQRAYRFLREGKSESENPYDDFYGKIKEFTAEEKKQIEKYRVRSGIMTSVAVALYILCWVPLVLLSTVSDIGYGNEAIWSTVGIAVMMLMIAVATAILIMKPAFKPLCLRGKNKVVADIDCETSDDRDDEKKFLGKKRARTLDAIKGAVWSVTVAVYLLMGFLQGLWHPGWIIFLIAAALNQVITAIFELTVNRKE